MEVQRRLATTSNLRTCGLRRAVPVQPPEAVNERMSDKKAPCVTTDSITAYRLAAQRSLG